MKERIRKALTPIATVTIFGLALIALHRHVSDYRLADIVAELRTLPAAAIIAAFLLTALNYFVLTGYDLLSLRILGHQLAYRKIAFASFVSYVVSHNVGMSFLSGSAVRLRVYASWNVSLDTIAKVIVLNGVTFWLGFLALTGTALLLQPELVLATLHTSRLVTILVGSACLLAVIAYVGGGAALLKPLRWRLWHTLLPSLRFRLRQLLISVADWALAGSVLYVLLPGSAQLSFFDFLGAFLLAQIAGVASHIPAGLGVFDGAMVLFLSHQLEGSTALAALLAYRIVYYVVPLMVAVLFLGTYEWTQHRTKLLRLRDMFGQWAPGLIPPLFAAGVFFCGAMLVLSGTTEPWHGRLRWVRDVLPLPVVEISHFSASVLGVLLLLLARGLQQRVDAAYGLTVVVLISSAIATLLKGLHIEEAAVLVFMAAALLPCRELFSRRASLLDQHLTPGWIAALAVVLLGSAWLLYFSHQRIEYSRDLWWHFEFWGHAPRALRASVGVSIVLVSYGIARLLRPAQPALPPPAAEDIVAVRSIVESTPDTNGNLALLGDKNFLFNDRRSAMIMYAISGRTWAAMGDPIGEPNETTELAWRFCEIADQYGGWPAFYAIGPQNLALYLDLGMTVVKLGEEARVDLSRFELAGRAHKSMRQHAHRVERGGCEFAIVGTSDVPAILDDLETISRAWLADKNTREKRFSLGRFDRTYLQQFPVAMVRRDQRIVAFANVWLGAGKEELSIDLMRYGADAPPGVMDYLFVKLMQWGRQEGYRWFNLGMAPLSGLDSDDMSSLWSRVGTFVFRNVEHFYSFQGLREYKEKFDPVWSPRYLASPSLLKLPIVLSNVAALISGGLSGVISR